MISKLRVPSVQDPLLQRIVNQIYDDFNKLVDSVNQEASEASDNFAGKAGNIRLVFDKATKKYYIEGKFETGWANVEVTLNER